MDGWIKLHRKLLDWEWYSDLPARVLFLHLLLRANYKETTWRGIKIKRGEHVTSLRKLAAETGLSVKQIRGALGRLERAHSTAHKRAHNCSIISVCEYETYQSPEEAKGTPKGTREGTQRAQQHVKKERNKENIIGEFSDLDREDFRKAWEAKEKHRQQLGLKKMTEIGQRRLFKKFQQWGIPKSIASIEHSIEKDWRGVFEVDTPLAHFELAEPAQWREALAKLKEQNPFDDDLARANPNWDWNDISAKIQKRIKDGTTA